MRDWGEVRLGLVFCCGDDNQGYSYIYLFIYYNTTGHSPVLLNGAYLQESVHNTAAFM